MPIESVKIIISLLTKWSKAKVDKVDKKYYYNFDLSLFDDLKVINKPLFEGDVNFYGKKYKNGLHPNNLGYQVIAQTLKKFIDAVHSK